MAGRRYVRDNRGRFAAVGATARGGRLATASGNKRATQTTELSGGKASGTISKPKGLKPGAIKAKPQVSSARQAATDRLKVKTQTRRAIRADRSSVVTPGQRSRLEAGRGSTMAGARPASTVAKPRTTGNTKQQVASRVERKLAAERGRMNIINRAERVGATQGNQRERSYKRQATLERAQTFLKTGKLPGKDNSIAAQRSMRQAKERLAAKNAARAAASKPARSRSAVGRIDGAKADRIIQRHDAMRPGLRPGTGSKARSMNSINTFLRARKFLLEPSRKVAKKGETISGQESIRRAVAGASKKARKRK